MYSVDDALDTIISTSCLTDDEQQQITHDRLTRNEQKRQLIQILKAKGQVGFDGLVSGLKKKKKYVATKLEKEVKKTEEEGLPECSAKSGVLIFPSIYSYFSPVNTG